MGWVKPYLTPTQLERLKEHRYCAEGTSLCEVFMQPYWRWLVTKVPLWVAPNTITMTGTCTYLLNGVNLYNDIMVPSEQSRWMMGVCVCVESTTDCINHIWQ